MENHGKRAPRRAATLTLSGRIALFLAALCAFVQFPAVSLAGFADASMTRADGVAMLYQAEGSPKAGSPKFSDIPANAGYADAVAWASENGIIGGYSNGTFGPNDLLLRQQFAVMLYRLVRSKGFGYQGPWTFAPSAADYGQSSEYAREGICWTVMQEILEVQNNAVRPRQTLTRSEAERALSRLYDFLNDDAVHAREGVYLGVEDYGSSAVTKDSKDEFRYRFFVNGAEERYGMDNGARDDNGAYSYELQNRLQEGELYRFGVRHGKVVQLEPLSALSGVLEAVEGNQITIDGAAMTLAEGAEIWKITTQAGGASVATAQLREGDSVRAVMDGESVRSIYLAPLAKPYTPPVTGTPGLSTLKNFLAVALTPVGTTLYHYGGGWNWQDNGAAVQTASIGLPSDWVRFFQTQDANYTYKDVNGDESRRDPAHSYYPFGEWNEYYYAGADCSGYVGWALYNTMNDQNGQPAFVGSGMVRKLTERGWGTLSQSDVNSANPLRPGDIVSISGHIYIVLGSCDDGSVVVLHSTPSDSRAGQPGGGVQIGAIGTSKSCAAYRLADNYMSKYYPDWYARYDVPLKSPEVYFAFDKEGRGRFRWNDSGEGGGLTDPDGWRNWNAQAVLESLFSEA